MPHQDELDSLQNNTVFIFNLNYKRKKKCFFYTPDGKVVAAQKVGGRSKSIEKSSVTSSTEEAPEDTGGLPIEDNLQEDQRVTAFVQLQLDRQGRMKASQVGHLGAILTNIIFDMFINQIIYVVFQFLLQQCEAKTP